MKTGRLSQGKICVAIVATTLGVTNEMNGFYALCIISDLHCTSKHPKKLQKKRTMCGPWQPNLGKPGGENEKCNLNWINECFLSLTEDNI